MSFYSLMTSLGFHLIYFNTRAGCFTHFNCVIHFLTHISVVREISYFVFFLCWWVHLDRIFSEELDTLKELG